MEEQIKQFDEKKYIESKNKVFMCCMALCLLLLFQVFLYIYTNEIEYMNNIKELEIICEVFPGYFTLYNDNTELGIHMDKDEDVSIEEFYIRSKQNPWERENDVLYIIRIDKKGELVFTDKDIMDGVKSFYMDCSMEALWKHYGSTKKVSV